MMDVDSLQLLNKWHAAGKLSILFCQFGQYKLYMGDPYKLILEHMKLTRFSAYLYL